ncbi:hypothetical protein COMA2_10002 [Candidatus Nitrospira nitrificans]|uniref:Uncharacterized protein n=1 Tax=Candidatus Nitrospira nitrificans TaxID=1742973 RepID=A0A0S4L3E7_9BACT|nr:hypothetical protein COMA2_10002 [Candidatus Nitrospira nitrificans]
MKVRTTSRAARKTETRAILEMLRLVWSAVNAGFLIGFFRYRDDDEHSWIGERYRGSEG